MVEKESFLGRFVPSSQTKISHHITSRFHSIKRPQQLCRCGDELVAGMSRVRVLVLLKTHRVDNLMCVKSFEAQSPPVMEVLKFRRGGTYTQLFVLSLDCGSKHEIRHQ
ncbi:hypothetical protein TNCV_313221 [Trichonephila clavipes]|nr:hypothetical protein TNCV_313221 [Trichonephila clavipes]